MVQAHQTLGNAAAAEKAIEHGDIPILMAETTSELEAARALDVFLEKLNSLGQALGKPGEWLKHLVHKGMQLQRASSPEADALLILLARGGDLAQRGRPSQRLKFRLGMRPRTKLSSTNL